MNFHIRALLYLITLFFLNSVSFSQLEMWKHYDKTNSGLPTNCIRQVVQDKKGIYWIATLDSGLVRFDGKNWKVYNKSNSPIPHNYIYSIDFDKFGYIWIGTYGGGLVRFNGKDDWKIFNESNSGLPCNWIYTVAIDKYSNVWIGTSNGGFAIYNRKKWKVYNTENSILKEHKVTYIYFDKYNDAWIGTSGLMYRIKKGKWFSEEQFNYNSVDDACYWITEDGNKNVFFCYKFGSIVFYDWKKFTIYTPTNSCLPFLGYYSIAVDKKNILWGGSFGNGLLRFENNKCQVWNKSNSELEDNLIFNVRVDKNNNKWISTYFGGIFIYNEKGVKF